MNFAAIVHDIAATLRPHAGAQGHVATYIPAHVHRGGAQPQLIDADHFSQPAASSRSQTAPSAPADAGQRTLSVDGPRRSSMWMLASGWVAGGELTLAAGLAPAAAASTMSTN